MLALAGSRGTKNPEQMVGLAAERLRATRETLRWALKGLMGPHELFVLAAIDAWGAGRAEHPRQAAAPAHRRGHRGSCPQKKGTSSESATRERGYDAGEVGEPSSLLEWLVTSRGRIRERALADVREAVDRTISELDIDLNLKTAIGFGLDRTLGAASLDSDDVNVWFQGGKVTRGRLAAVGLSRPLSKLNARGILQGWGVVALAAGLPGLLITVDNFDQVMAPKTENAPYYTRLRREETYEMLRQFIDDADALQGIWLVVAARPELFSDERRGIKSYPALDARVVNEVEARALNRFEDHVDWDRLWAQDPDSLTMLMERWAEYLHTNRIALPPSPGRVSPVRRSVLALGQEVERHDGSH